MRVWGSSIEAPVVGFRDTTPPLIEVEPSGLKNYNNFNKVNTNNILFFINYITIDK